MPRQAKEHLSEIALTHRHYRSFSQIQVSVYPDKLIIMNTGALAPEVAVRLLNTDHLPGNTTQHAYSRKIIA
jgi:hypothetical protein